jgi:hypothetical protein
VALVVAALTVPQGHAPMEPVKLERDLVDALDAAVGDASDDVYFLSMLPIVVLGLPAPYDDDLPGYNDPDREIDTDNARRELVMTALLDRMKGLHDEERKAVSTTEGPQ